MKIRKRTSNSDKPREAYPYVVVPLNYCSQNGGNLYRAPYYNGNPNIGPRMIGNLDQYPCVCARKFFLSHQCGCGVCGLGPVSMNPRSLRPVTAITAAARQGRVKDATTSPLASQRVHVGIWYILRAQRGSHIPTLRPKYTPYSYMDPWGSTMPPAAVLYFTQLPVARSTVP